MFEHEAERRSGALEEGARWARRPSAVRPPAPTTQQAAAGTPVRISCLNYRHCPARTRLDRDLSERNIIMTANKIISIEERFS